MASVVFTPEQLETLGYKLGAFDDQFNPEERALIQGIMARGIAGLREDEGEDVSGFIALLVPAVQKVREADGRRPGAPGGDGSLQVNMGDGSVMPTDQFSLNFTKISY